jgi:hypothetical protein
MRAIFYSCLAVVVMLVSLPLSHAFATPLQQSVRPEGSFMLAVRDNDRICCKRGWQDWWSNWRQCRRAGGVRVANRECRDDWNEKWDLRWFSWNGRDWNRRVCCKRGRHDWWTSARECREAFGYQTANRECRN